MTEKRALCYVPSAWSPRKKPPEPLPPELRDRLFDYILKKVNNYYLAQDLTEITLAQVQKETPSRELSMLLSRGKKIANRECTLYFSERHDLLLDEFHMHSSVLDLLTHNDVEVMPSDLQRQGELIELLHRTILELPEKVRNTLLLRYFDRLSLADVAKKMDISSDGVLRQLKKGRKVIGKVLATYEKTNGLHLNCVGVVPLLLWLARQYRSFANVPLTGTGVSAVYFGEITQKTKERGILTAFKIIIGILVAAIIIAGILILPQFFGEDPQPTAPGQSTTQPAGNGTTETPGPTGTGTETGTPTDGTGTETPTEPGTTNPGTTTPPGPTTPPAGPTNPPSNPTNPPSNPTNPPATTQPEETDPSEEEGPTTPIIEF